MCHNNYWPIGKLFTNTNEEKAEAEKWDKIFVQGICPIHGEKLVREVDYLDPEENYSRKKTYGNNVKFCPKCRDIYYLECLFKLCAEKNIPITLF